MTGPFVSAAAQALGGGNSGVFDSGNAEGWTVTAPAATAGQTISVARQGFTAATTPVATTYTDTFTIIKKLRQAYPNTGTLNTANLWALSDYVLSTDTPAGFVNNSTLIAPKPVCNFDEPSRTMIGNSLHIGVVCFSRDARNGSEVAAVVVTATDGTNTVSATATAMQVSAYGGDQNPVVDYEVTLNTTSLTDNHIVTVNATAYPWIGADNATHSLSSVQRSADSAVLREFSPRYYLKNTGRTAAPYYAYVCPAVSVGSCPATAGNDTNGLWSSTAATAAATPFATIGGAVTALGNASHGIPAQSGGLAIGAADGAIIRVGQGTSTLGGVAANQVQNVAALTITRDPAVTRAAAIVSTGTGGSRFRLGNGGTLTSPVTEGAVTFKDVSVLRGGNTTILNGNGGGLPDVLITFDNVNYDNASTSNTISPLSNAQWGLYGVVATNVGTNVFTSGGTSVGLTDLRIVRGLSATGGNYDTYLVLGSTVSNPIGIATTSSKPDNKSIFAFNRVLNISTTTGYYLNAATAQDIPDGTAFVQNLLESTNGSGNSATAIFGGDGASASVTNQILQYNTFTGAHLGGRQFLGYDQTTQANGGGGVSVARKLKFYGVLGNIWVDVYSKVDWFDGANSDTGTGVLAPSNRTGGWAQHMGAGWNGNLIQFNAQDQGGIGGGAFQLEVPLLTTQYPTNANPYFRLDPLFVNDQSTKVTSTGTGPYTPAWTAGAGGGDYHLQSGSPCKSAVARAALPFDLGGTARPATNDSCGAYY